jgi:phytoene dehydrogenase-like protein
MNFLVHNMCRLPAADGTWMIVQGGMGTVARLFAEACLKEGVEILPNSGVEQIHVTAGRADGVMLKSGVEIRAKAVLCNADPYRMQQLVGRGKFPAEFNATLEKLKRTGTTMKVNLALRELPKFKCLPENRGQHNATIHLLPPEKDVMANLRRGFEEVKAGRLADFPTIEWYIHTQADPSLRDDRGHHNSAFFVQWVPYALSGGKSWETEEAKYVDHLFDIAERFAPGFRDSVVDTFTLTPPKIEKHLGITWGHIHHIDNTFGFDQRVPYALPIPGLYSCSAGTHPAGSVIGAAGHNSAERVARDLGV